MLADVHHHMSAEAAVQPAVEHQTVLRRRQCRIVVGCLGIDIVAASRLHDVDEIAEAVDGEAKGAVANVPIVDRRSPSRRDGVAHRAGQCLKPAIQSPRESVISPQSVKMSVLVRPASMAASSL